MVPVDGKDGNNGEWFLFNLNENDSITQDGTSYVLFALASHLTFCI